MKETMSKTRVLVECAILLGISTVLSIFPRFSGLWANGGSVTVCSMLPIILASYRHGPKWGLLTGLGFSVMQMLGGIYLPAGGLGPAAAGLALDYILPFTLVGLGGVFRGKIGNKTAVELCAGTALALTLRYLCHVASGYILWQSLVDTTAFFEAVGGWGTGILAQFSGKSLFLVYSFIYNGSFMLPELIITLIGAALISRLALMGIPGQGTEVKKA